eukprot:1625799-Lingulodinium_polyedra.AAC.1
MPSLPPRWPRVRASAACTTGMAPRRRGSTVASRQSSGPQTCGAPHSRPAAASCSNFSAAREPHTLSVCV